MWPRPYQEPHPPIWIPSQGSAETKDWASHPDRKYTMLMTFSPVKNVIRNMNAYSNKCEEYGYKCQPEQLGWALPLYVAETDEKAIEEARDHIQNFFNKFVLAPTEYRMPPGYSSINSYKMILENKMKFREQFLSIEMLMENGMFICGSPSTVVEKLEEYQSAMGYGNLVIMGQFATLSHDQTKKSMQMFAEEVMPKLRHIGAPTAAAAE